MLTISPQALAYIQEKNKAIFLDIPPLISCCLHLKESPTVRFGEPHNLDYYTKVFIQGVTVFMPHDLPEAPLSIELARFFCFKRLVIGGWCLA